LDKLDPGEVSYIAFPGDQSGEAAGWFTGGMAALYSMLSFGAPNQALVDRVGIELSHGQGRPSVVRFVTADPRTSVRVFFGENAQPPTSDAFYNPPGEPGVSVADLSRLPEVTLVSDEGGVSVRWTRGGIYVQEIRPFNIAPLVGIEAPVMDWLQNVSDTWVVAEAKRLVESRTSWCQVVAAGLIARHVEPPRGVAAREAVGRLLHGEVDPIVAAPRAWARTLTRAQLQTIEDLALSEVDVIQLDLQELLPAVHENREGWQQRWHRLCQRRDELEDVRLILHEANADHVLSDALLDIDQEGEALRLSVPWTTALEDERATRVAAGDPFAWWGAGELA
jgi:hypothetical protein